MPWTKKVRPGQTINLGFNGRFEADGEAPQTVTKSFVGMFQTFATPLNTNYISSLSSKMTNSSFVSEYIPDAF